MIDSSSSPISHEPSEMAQAVLFNIQAIVDHPQKVIVKEVSLDSQTLITCKVDDSDMAKVLGRKGATIDAVRTLIYAIAGKRGMKVLLQVTPS